MAPMRLSEKTAVAVFLLIALVCLSAALVQAQEVEPGFGTATGQAASGANTITITAGTGLSGTATATLGTAATTITLAFTKAYLEDGTVSVAPGVTTATITFTTLKSSAAYSVTFGSSTESTSTYRPYVDPASKTVTDCVVTVEATGTTQTFDWHAQVR